MTFKSALKMLKPYRARMMAIMALALIISGISAIAPFVSRKMLDDGLLQAQTRTVVSLVLLLILLQVGSQLIEYLQRVQEIKITNDIGEKMKTDVFEHGLKLKPHYFREQNFYKTVSDALYDVSHIMNITNNSFLTFFVIICKFIGAIIGLVILDRRLAIIIIAIIPLKAWLNIVMRRRAEKHNRRVIEDNKNYSRWFSNIISGVVDIKLWGLERKTIKEYSEHIKTINESSKRLSLMTAKNSLFSSSIEYIWVNALYILGAFLIAGDKLTFGGLIAFITFAAYVLGPVNIIMDLRIIMGQITPSVESIKRFYELEEENYSASLPLNDKIETIEFKNVSVFLGGKSIIKNINFKINSGEKVAIIGDNGSGKTTLVSLLLRLHEPTDGEILVNGISISEYGIEDYRRKFSVVTQAIHLFNGTIDENIDLDRKKNVSSVKKYKHLDFCVETIESWDDGYETQVGSEGAKLSGGERQKIALLRALNRQSEILVLDEPTSNYDKESDEEFNRYIQENNDYNFYFIVTHRQKILSGMDRVILLENGELRVI
jgi:ATP-binding cassette subfamily B protein